jgi:HEPN domain-containing protein
MDDAKRALVQGWLQRASDDLTAARSLAEQQPRLLGVVAYHCQQAAEKAVKGFLAYFDEPHERTHDVGRLIEKAMRIESGFATWHAAGQRLTPLATAYRYPQEVDQPQPDPEDIEEALDDADTILRQVLTFLPVEVHPEA